MQSRAVAWILAGAAVFASPHAAWAQAEASESSRTEPAELIEQGIALRRSGQDAQALPLFQKAEKLDPSSTRIKVHLAATYHALGQWEEADRYLTEALQDTSDPYVQKHQATLASARRTIDSHIGRLKVIGGPRGTEVLLNGRSLGTLPIEQTVRVEAGIYTLQAKLPGHYPVTRSVALSGGALVQESIELRPHASAEPEPVLRTEERPSVDDSGGPTWLTWTLSGLAVGAGAVTVAAWVSRERHADRWNDDDACLGPMQTREQLCGSERRDGERAETYMWIAGGTTLALTAAAIGTLWLGGREEQPEASALSCGIGLSAVQCAGRF